MNKHEFALWKLLFANKVTHVWFQMCCMKGNNSDGICVFQVHRHNQHYHFINRRILDSMSKTDNFQKLIKNTKHFFSKLRLALWIARCTEVRAATTHRLPDFLKNTWTQHKNCVETFMKHAIFYWDRAIITCHPKTGIEFLRNFKSWLCSFSWPKKRNSKSAITTVYLYHRTQTTDS